MPWFPCPRQAAGGVLCARRLPIRSSSFAYSTVTDARVLIDSLDALSVFEAAVVDDRTHDRVERRARGLDLCTDNFDMDISWGTPY